MKRIIIFIGLKILEIGLPILCYMNGHYFLYFIGGKPSDNIWLDRFGGVVFFILTIMIAVLIGVFFVKMLPSFIKNNWENAGKILYKWENRK